MQGYEKRGLMKPVGKTSSGYLFYDQETKERVIRIRRLQSYGFSLSEIAVYQNAGISEQHSMLAEKLRDLKIKRDKIDCCITELQTILSCK